MSVDKVLRDMVRDEVQRAMGPMAAAISELQAQGAIIARLAGAFGGGAFKRGPGRPPKLLTAGRRGPGRPGRKAGEARPCALKGCRRSARSKGYCSAHYQKFRMLAKTDRLPADWVENAAPGSVKNLVLPRGRAGAKALAESRKKK
ncbi:MAG: cell wall protein [Myxococcales bacterium]|nr:cell wall protein [Myxococcales bacterium]